MAMLPAIMFWVGLITLMVLTVMILLKIGEVGRIYTLLPISLFVGAAVARYLGL